MRATTMLQRAYFSYIEDASSLQQRILRTRETLELFGVNALPLDATHRGHLDTLRRGPETIESNLRLLESRLAKLMPIIEEMERVFAMADQDAADKLASGLLQGPEPLQIKNPKPPTRLRKKKRKRSNGEER